MYYFDEPEFQVSKSLCSIARAVSPANQFINQMSNVKCKLLVANASAYKLCVGIKCFACLIDVSCSAQLELANAPRLARIISGDLPTGCKIHTSSQHFLLTWKNFEL